MSTRWYYQLLMEEFGPVSATAVRQLLKDGTLSPTDLVRAEDSADWISASSIPTSAADLIDEPEAISDLSELAFNFEDAGVSERRAAPVVNSAPVANELATAVLAPAPQYYTQSVGQILGPMSFADLIGMAESGALDHGDLVRFGEEGEWKQADEFQELTLALDQGACIVEAPISNAPPSTRRLFPTAGRPVDASAVEAPAESDSSPAENVADQAEVDATAGLPGADSQPDADDQSGPGEQAASFAAEGDRSEDGSPKKVARKKSRKPKASKEDEKLLNEIFDDVFADNEKPTRGSMPPAAGVPTAAVAASMSGPDSGEKSPSATQTSVPKTVPSSVIADKASSAAAVTSGATAAATVAPQPATAAPAPVSASVPLMSAMSSASPAASPVPMPTPKAKRSLQLDGAVIRNVGIALAVLVVAGAIWQFGIPGLGIVSTGRYSGRLKEVVAQYKSMGDTATQAQWQEFSNASRLEFMTYYKTMLESGATGGENVALADGLKSVIALASLSFDDKEQRKTLLEKAEKAVSGLK